MKFDKSKILTVVTADQAKVGQKGWFAKNIEELRKKVDTHKTSELLNISYYESDAEPFRSCLGMFRYPLFYPAPEPSYEERQAQWVKENNVKAGTKVRVTRTFTEDEDGSCCCEHDDLVGMTGVVRNCNIDYYNLRVDMNAGKFKLIPYFALEVIKEPTYRPYNNDELNDLVGEVLTNKQSGRKKVVTGKPTASEGVNLDGSYITAKDLLASFYRNGDEPCGVKEEI